MEIAQLHIYFKESSGICTDTRKLVSGQIYFALKGENFNGNSFAKNALENGAKLAVIDEQKYRQEGTILVEDVLKSLQDLATYHRNYLNIPIIGLTGSNGKTTTKELINVVLSQKYKTYATQGNFNNHIGVPLTLLSMDDTTEIGVVEMGANHQKEIAALCEIAKPNYGYITNFGKAHLEGFGGIEGVIKGKSELYDFLRATNGTAIINDQDAIQIEKSKGMNLFKFGSDRSNYPIQLQSAQPTISIITKHAHIKSNLIGSYNFSNIAAATAIGHQFDLAHHQIKKGIELYIPENNRSQIIEKDNFSIILDAYNANPTSMAAALNNLSQQKGSTIAFLGDMFEVGETTLLEHQSIVDLAFELHIDKLYAIGESFGACKVPTNLYQVYSSFSAFAKAHPKVIIPEGMVLIKGSRGMKMERILDFLSQ